MKSSCRKRPAKRPDRSVTVAVTLISSTPLLKRKPSCCCANGVVPAIARSTAAIAHARGPRRNLELSPEPGAWSPTCLVILLPSLERDAHGLLGAGRDRCAAPIDVRHDAFVGPETHAIARHVGRRLERHDER